MERNGDAPGDVLRHCADQLLCWMEGNQCTGRPTAPLRGLLAVLDRGHSVHRATYCAHNYPLPLLPSGPGGVGGITSRRTRHRNHFITQRSPPPTCATASVQNLPTLF